MPMFRRVPKRGFNNRWAVTVFAVNVGKLNEHFEDGAEVTLEAMAPKTSPRELSTKSRSWAMAS